MDRRSFIGAALGTLASGATFTPVHASPKAIVENPDVWKVVYLLDNGEVNEAIFAPGVIVHGFEEYESELVIDGEPVVSKRLSLSTVPLTVTREVRVCGWSVVYHSLRVHTKSAHFDLVPGDSLTVDDLKIEGFFDESVTT